MNRQTYANHDIVVSNFDEEWSAKIPPKVGLSIFIGAQMKPVETNLTYRLYKPNN